MKRAGLLIAGVSIFLASSVIAAESLEVSLSIDRPKVAPGKQAQLSLTIAGAVDIPPPEIPPANGVDARFQRSEPGPASVTHLYRIVPPRPGRYEIGPAVFRYKGALYRSNTVTIEATKEAAAPVVPPRPSGAGIAASLADRIYVTLEPAATTFYVGERVPLTFTLYSDWFDLENISIAEVSSAEAIVEKFVKGASEVTTKDGVRYAVLTYLSAVFAPTPGSFTIEPVKVTFDITRPRPLPSGEMPELLNDNTAFYDRLIGAKSAMAHVIETAPIPIKALPLPAAGRPESFRNAVGAFSFAAWVEPSTLKAGETVTVRMSVTGSGNFSALTAIDIPEREGIRQYEPALRKAPGSFSAEQVLRIMTPAVREVPAITFSFFDPARKEYVSLTQGPFPLTVTGTAPSGPEAPKPVGAAADADKPPEERLIGPKDAPGTFTDPDPLSGAGAIPALLVALPVFLFAIAVIIKKRMTFLETDQQYARWYRMVKESGPALSRAERLWRRGRTKEFYDHAFNFMQQYLGARLFMPPEGITEIAVREIMDSVIEDALIQEKVRSVFGDCHLARFTESGQSAEAMASTFRNMKEIVSYMNDRTYLLDRKNAI